MNAQLKPAAVDAVNRLAWRKLRGRACAYHIHCDDAGDLRASGREGRCDQCRVLDRVERLLHVAGDIESAALQAVLASLDAAMSDYLEGWAA